MSAVYITLYEVTTEQPLDEHRARLLCVTLRDTVAEVLGAEGMTSSIRDVGLQVDGAFAVFASEADAA